MNKKGVIFTIAAVVISTLIVTMYLSLIETPADTKTELTRIKLRQSNFYISQIQEYTENIATQSTKKILQNITDKLIQDKNFPTTEQFQEIFKKCLINESVEGWCDQQTTIQQKLNEYAQFGEEKIGFQTLNITVKNQDQATIYQEDPWHIITEINLSIIADDNYAKWNIQDTTIKTKISILNMKDPTYQVANNNQNSQEIINEYGHEKKITTRNTTEWLIPSTLNNYQPTGIYFHSKQGISYLDRLTNQIRPSECCGLNSLINTTTVYESQEHTEKFMQEYGSSDFLFYKQPDNAIIEWNLVLWDFWNNIETTNNKLTEVWAEINLNETTGKNINGSIVPNETATDTSMPKSTPPKNYTIPLNTYDLLICGDGACKFPEQNNPDKPHYCLTDCTP